MEIDHIAMGVRTRHRFGCWWHTPFCEIRTKPPRPESRKAALRRFAVYCLAEVLPPRAPLHMELAPGERVFAPLNREYYRVGRNSGPKGPDAADAYHLIRERDVDLSAALRVSKDGLRLYLFDDDCLPWASARDFAAYRARHARVFEPKGQRLNPPSKPVLRVLHGSKR